MDALLLGVTIGFAAGVSPGPLLFLTLTSALRSGARTGVAVACAPLVSDVVVVTMVLLVLGRLPADALNWIGVVGGVFVVWLGAQTLRGARVATLRGVGAAEPPATWQALRDGVVVNFLSPHPWITWATALGPLVVRTWHDGHTSGVALVAGFYLTLVGAKVVLALIVARTRGRLSDRGYRLTLSVAAGLLVAAGAALLVEFGRPLL